MQLNPGGTYYSHVDGVTISTTGNAVDFGDLTTAKQGGAGTGKWTWRFKPWSTTTSVTYMPGSGRGLIAGGRTPSYLTQIELVHIPTLGNTSDFGDLATGRGYGAGNASVTRVLYGGGQAPSESNIIGLLRCNHKVTLQIFGDLTAVNQGPSGASSTTRGLFLGGAKSAPSAINVIQYVTIASAGNATDFGGSNSC